MAAFKLLESAGRAARKRLRLIISVLAGLALLIAAVLLAFIFISNATPKPPAPTPLVANSAVLPATAIPHQVVFPRVLAYVNF